MGTPEGIEDGIEGALVGCDDGVDVEGTADGCGFVGNTVGSADGVAVSTPLIA